MGSQSADSPVECLLVTIPVYKCATQQLLNAAVMPATYHRPNLVARNPMARFLIRIINMKYRGFLTSLLLLLLTACLTNGCNSPANEPVVTNDGPGKNASAAAPVKFRTGIDSNNAYSNLFADSNRLEKFIRTEKVDTVAATDLRNFYNNRAFQLAWFNDSGFTEQALAFRSLYDYDKDSSTGRKMLDAKLDELVNKDSLVPSAADPHIVNTEFMMSWRLVNYLNRKHADQNEKAELLTNLVPFQKQSVANWASAMQATKAGLADNNQWYVDLQKLLNKLLSVQKSGGWPALPVLPKRYRAKTDSVLIGRLKKRLIIDGVLLPGDTSGTPTPSLRAAVKKANAQFGYSHNTVLTANLLKELNVPVEARIRQVLINLQRMRWMPELPAKKSILVNIPAFEMQVRESGRPAFDMDIITGKEGHSTVVFSGSLNQVVFSPYWNLPDSIVKKEILPQLAKNKDYLEAQHMEQTGERKGLPVIRQVPGEWNELGKVKFLFPNSQHIYFHDTPHKWLFNKDQRAYSHGCIRLAEPKKLAIFLLKDVPGWTSASIDSAMNSEQEKNVRLTEPVPVFIYYYTAWAGEDGVGQYRKDIYGHDRAMAGRLFSASKE